MYVLRKWEKNWFFYLEISPLSNIQHTMLVFIVFIFMITNNRMNVNTHTYIEWWKSWIKDTRPKRKRKYYIHELYLALQVNYSLVLKVKCQSMMHVYDDDDDDDVLQKFSFKRNRTWVINGTTINHCLFFLCCFVLFSICNIHRIKKKYLPLPPPSTLPLTLRFNV